MKSKELVFLAVVFVTLNYCQAVDVDSKVLLVMLDGVRHDFFKFTKMTNLVHLSLRGVRADRLKPVYPSLTWPAMTSLVTGVYPETHGVVYNIFYDPKLNRTFNVSTDGTNPLAFQAIPITTLNVMQGGKFVCNIRFLRSYISQVRSLR